MSDLEPQWRPAATLRLRVPELSSLHGIVQSEPIYIQNLQWRLRVKPSLDANRKNQALGVFLYCEGLRESKTWSCKAVACFRLLPQRRGLAPHLRELNSKFHADAMDWGYPQFYEWIPLEGYINVEGDYLDLEADVLADQPNYQDLEVAQESMTVKKARLEAKVGAESPNGVLQWKSKADRLFWPHNKDWDSLPTFIRGLKWRLVVVPNAQNDSVLTKSLGIYLRCCTDGHMDQAQWKCDASISFMVKAKQGYPSFCREMTHVFRSGSINQVGIQEFTTMDSLFTPTNGFIKYGNIELQVLVQAEVPIITTRPNNLTPTVETVELINVELQPERLRCPICDEIHRAEIYQCLNGHIICNSCMFKLEGPNRCPQCQIPLEVQGQRIRNRAMESLMLDVP